MEKRFEEILHIALLKRCTDIHIKCVENNASVSLRTIDGLLQIKSSSDDERLYNYLMYLSRLDVTSNKPQSGSFNYFFEGQYYDFRFAVIITSKLKTGVLRILNCHDGLPIEKITFDKSIQRRLVDSINKKNGLVIFSGPTGSGKTTTMYSLLRLLEGKTIYSLEDPIEVVQDNVVQLEINANKGFGFDEGIRQILRHNPDVLMIGEIRDETTAKMAIRAALTGCLVISSLHSPSTAAALHRLLELGVNKDDLMEIMEIVFNQRLVKLKDAKQYSCVFDYLDNQGIRQYLEDGKYTNGIRKRLSEAIEKGLIEDEGY